MMLLSNMKRLAALALAASVVTAGVGCWSSGYESVDEADEFVLGDLIEDFDPPTLEELNEQVTWVDGEVLDGMALMRQRQEEEGEPPVSVEEALAMKNDSPEANDQILAALGRLPELSEQEVDYDAGITRHTTSDVKSTNPVMVSSSIEMDISSFTSFGLFGFDWNFRPFASKDTVASWQTSEDRMYDKVVMRDDLTWSDGEPITAHDVEFSYKVIMSDAVPVPAVGSGTEDLKYVKAYDDRTVVFFHEKPLATNVWNINFPIIPKHIYEDSIAEDPTLQDSDYHVKMEKNPVAGGPYEIVGRKRDQEIVLQRREDYYMHDGEQVRDKPHFKTIRYRIISEPSVALLRLKAGDIDDKILTAEEWQTKTNDESFYDNNTKAFGTEWTYFYFGWNNKSPFFSDQQVRKAMSLAFDHDEMLNTLLFGLYEPSNGVFHPDSRWSPDDPPAPYKQDIAQAEALLEEAGWTDHDGDGVRDKEINGRRVPFEFSILVMNAPDRIAICNLLKQNLAQLGVTVNVRPLEFTVLQEKTQSHEFQAYFGGWGTGATPDTSENIWKSDADRNFVQYENPEIDKLFEEAKSELDENKREKMFEKIHLTLYEDQPYTWLYFRNSFYAFNKDLRGYNFSPRGPEGYSPGFSSWYKPAAQ